MYKSKGLIDLQTSPVIKEHPCTPDYPVAGSDSFSTPRYTMHMVKDSSIT